MKRALPTLAASLGLATACGVTARPAAPAAPRSRLSLTFEGVAGWQLDADHVTVLVDPYFSRPKIDPDALMLSDEAAVAPHVPAHADLILVGHSHADHLLDAPTAARLTSAQVMGTESTAHYVRAAGVPPDKIITVKGGEDFEFGAFSVRVIPSLHSALDGKHAFGASQLIPAEVTLPLSFERFAEGGTLAYLVRAGGHEVLFLDTANFIEHELEGVHPDVAVVATGLRSEIHDYACRLMRVLGDPPLVFSNHFDDWRAPPTSSAALSPEAKADLARFTDEIHACSPSTRVIVPEPFQATYVE